ncbi:MAG: citrate synthase [Kiritimatiellia bacterium]
MVTKNKKSAPEIPDAPALDTRLLAHYEEQARTCAQSDPLLYSKYNVKRGLRNEDGSGVLVGLTRVGSVHGYVVSENEIVSVPGVQYFRGIDVQDLVHGFQQEKRPGFEETAFLLLFGNLPTPTELEEWSRVLDAKRTLPYSLLEKIIREPSRDIMNSLARSVLAAYSDDETPDAINVPAVLRQSIELIARFSAMAAYAYQAKMHYYHGESLFVRNPVPGKSTAENFLMMMREDAAYTALEAELLDLCLVLHAEHGGGNNSAFTTHVVTSAATDTYSAIAAATLSLKGPRHGGANLRVMQQMDEIKDALDDWTDETAVSEYLRKILRKEAGDGSGLIYGLGHAVYTLSDPRALLLKEKARELAESKGRMDEFNLYEAIDRLGPSIFNEGREKRKDLCANVDFYSGFVYDMLNIPMDLYTPLFAISRVVGWSAHRLEELINGGPIVRPAFKAVSGSYLPYKPLDARQ